MNALSSPLDRAFFCGLTTARRKIRQPAASHPSLTGQAPPAAAATTLPDSPRSMPPPSLEASRKLRRTDTELFPQMLASPLRRVFTDETPLSGPAPARASSTPLFINLLLHKSQNVPSCPRKCPVLPARKPERFALFHGSNREIPRTTLDIVSPCNTAFSTTFRQKCSVPASRRRQRSGRTRGNSASRKTFQGIGTCV